MLPGLAGRHEALHRQQARDTGEVRQGVPGSHRWWAWARGQTLDGTFIYLDTLIRYSQLLLLSANINIIHINTSVCHHSSLF